MVRFSLLKGAGAIQSFKFETLRTLRTLHTLCKLRWLAFDCHWHCECLCSGHELELSLQRFDHRGAAPWIARERFRHLPELGGGNHPLRPVSNRWQVTPPSQPKGQLPVSDSKKTAVALKVGDRVEIHPANDLWMMGARFGAIVAIDSERRLADVKMDKFPDRAHTHRFNLVDLTRIEGSTPAQSDDSRKLATPAEIVKARARYGSDDIEIDDNAQVSVGSDPGVWVQAWVWVEDDAATDARDADWMASERAKAQQGKES